MIICVLCCCFTFIPSACTLVLKCASDVHRGRLPSVDALAAWSIEAMRPCSTSWFDGRHGSPIRLHGATF